MRRIGLVMLTTAQLVAGCDQLQTPTDLSPRMAISDGAHDGNEHFYFLPPLVPDPTYSGTFDPTLSPLVTITDPTNQTSR